MDTRSNQVPFTLKFIQPDGMYTPPTVLNATIFYTEEDALYLEGNESILEITENKNLSVLFTNCDEDARLYMDGLEMIPGKVVEIDENGEPYILPSTNEQLLFTYDYFPLIPGHYQVMVMVGDTKYYSLVSVKTKEMTKDQWRIMVNEVESIIKGLAQDLVRKQMGADRSIFGDVPPQLLHQFFVLRKHFPSVMAALSDLENKVNFRIKKEYVIVPIVKAKHTDEETIRYRLRHPEKKNTLKTPIRQTYYDLPENRWVKRIVETIVNKLILFKDGIEEAIDIVNDEIQHLSQYQYKDSTKLMIAEKELIINNLNQYGELAKKMRSAFELIRQTSWYQIIPQTTNNFVPHVMHSDVRYRALYQLYRDINSDDYRVELDPSYTYQWKRTDRLYELWGFIQLMNVLSKDLDYKPFKGWLYDRDYNHNVHVIPRLSPDTIVSYKKDDIQLNLVYDGTLPYESKKTIHDQPLWAMDSHNRPDGRLDVYKDWEYLGSLIFDFKYRPRKNIWRAEKVRQSNRTDVMRQLTSYASGISSPYLFDLRGTGKFQALRPIHEVWAIHPSKEGNEETKEYSDHRLKIVQLSPGHENRHVSNELQFAIKGVLERKDILLKDFTNLQP
ncbi:DUF2357 domain-containing protein [Brevibacillus sp. MS2.2]|uniref:DUF2357 domain-containing protein n=1 Tax=Brevibacillus sp. MS2.2 TaxID=2738981 RepID=UPI00156B18D2|nr:DUF2357 domain-containing protein [Brevibacillus sp. MS2.2]NRR23657.1 DUF2357 domain-containing protein [Brevibacillus sp. MS2.2]